MDNRRSSDDLKKRPQKGAGAAAVSRADSRTSAQREREQVDRILADSAKLSSHSAAESRDISSHSSGEVDLMSRSRGSLKQKKRRMRIACNVILSIVLALSTLTFTLSTLAGSKLLHNQNIDEDESGKFEEINYSLNENVAYILVCGVDLSENLTDVIMLACYDLANNNVNVLQIPRDTFVGTDVPTGKVNAVYGHARDGESKIKALMRCINQKFGLPVDHYATVTIKGTERIIDIIGGIDIHLERRFKLVDDTGKKDVKKVFEAGDVHLDGQWGTAFIRHRASYDQGDMGRIKAQRSVYAALLKKMTTLDFGQIASLVTQAAGEISTDLTLTEMLGYAQKMRELKLTDVNIMSVPGTAGYYSPTGQSLSYYSADKTKLCAMLNEYFRPYESTTITPADLEITQLHSGSGDSYYNEFLAGGNLTDFDTEKPKETSGGNE